MRGFQHSRSQQQNQALNHPPSLTCGDNIEGKGAISVRQLFNNTLRMRPSRIIRGEIRGEEALDYLQAINSDHEGTLAVLDASTPADVVGRLETSVRRIQAHQQTDQFLPFQKAWHPAGRNFLAASTGAPTISIGTPTFSIPSEHRLIGKKPEEIILICPRRHAIGPIPDVRAHSAVGKDILPDNRRNQVGRGL